MIEAVVCHIVNGDRILLIYKKRGHGAGKYNGVGGKIEEGESPKECVLREAKEELGIELMNVEKVGEIMFYNVNGEDWFVYIFLATNYRGKEKESDEVSPKWFPISRIPYEKMWEDDSIWLPKVLEGIKFRATFWFSGEEMRGYEIKKNK